MNITISKVNTSTKYSTYRLSKKIQSNAPIAKKDCMLNFLANLSESKRADIQIQKNEEEFFNEFLCKGGKVTLEEYKDIKQNHPMIIEKALLYYDNHHGKMRSTPKSMAEVVIGADRYLRQNYENFRIISLGTSPSIIAEQLALMGHDVIFLPVTGICNYEAHKDSLSKTAEINTLMKYLKSKKIDDGKLNIVLDYTSSGKTLREISKLIRRYFSLKSDRIEKLSTNELLQFTFYSSRTNYTADAITSNIEMASNTPHFPVFKRDISRYKNMKIPYVSAKNKEDQKVFEEFENYSAPFARAFSLCCAYEIDKMLSQGNS